MKNAHNSESVGATIKAEKLVSGTRDFELLQNPEHASEVLGKRAVELLGINEGQAGNNCTVKRKESGGRSVVIKYFDRLVAAMHSSKVVVKSQTSDIFNQEFKKTIKHKS